MATEEDLEKDEQQDDEAEDQAAAEAEASPDEESRSAAEAEAEVDAEAGDDAPKKPTSVVAKSAVSKPDLEDDDVDVAAPTQLGAKRFVYAAYFGGAITVAFLVSKILGYAWFRIGTVKPQIGEPSDEVVMPISAAIGAAVAFYYWKRTRTRQLAEEVADELSKVTWPDKTEVTNSTIVTLVVTALSVIFFFLMDRFWGFVTNLVYGT